MVGISSALPKLGVKTRAEWLRKLADKDDAAAYRASKASEYAIAYGSPSSTSQPTEVIQMLVFLFLVIVAVVMTVFQVIKPLWRKP